MSAPAKFLFQNDFRTDTGSRISDADLAQAFERGVAQGMADGHAQASAEIQATYAAIVANLSEQLAGLLAHADQRDLAMEEASIRLSVDLSQKIAGAALTERPLAALETAIREAFGHARGAPHLVARVNDSAVDEMDRLVARLSRETGFSGRVVVLGDPEIVPGDARLEWADGGISIDQAGLQKTVRTAIASLFGPGFQGAGAIQSAELSEKVF
jgi:flagellar assembly protein FliH